MASDAHAAGEEDVEESDSDDPDSAAADAAGDDQLLETGHSVATAPGVIATSEALEQKLNLGSVQTTSGLAESRVSAKLVRFPKSHRLQYLKLGMMADLECQGCGKCS